MTFIFISEGLYDAPPQEFAERKRKKRKNNQNQPRLLFQRRMTLVL